ncbi:MAG TPA: ATPase domain-containing protein [Thermoplasmata archaeon]
MVHGVDVEWVQTGQGGGVSKQPEELEGELKELRDEVRRLREQVAAFASATKGLARGDERLPTFVGRVDASLEGGVPKGAVIAITGPGGSMKTSLALYILARNRAAGRRGVYVTVEESRESILRTMRHLGLETDEDFIVDISRLRVEREGAEEIRDWLRVLRDFLVRRNQREPISLVVIDTLDVLASMAHLTDVRNELFHFFHFLRSMSVTTYVVAEVDPVRPGVAHDVIFLADGVFELRFSGAGEGKVQLLFRCVKMRHTNHSRDYFVLRYDKGFAARPFETAKPSRWGRGRG